MTLRERLIERLAGDVIARRVGDAETRMRAAADERVREALSAGLTRADEQLIQQGFRRLTSQQTITTRDLTPLAQDQMLTLAYWLWESNPLAQWLVEVVVDFVWGEGGKVDSADENVKQVIRGFWNDPVNRLQLRMEDWIRETGLQGELCLPVFVNEVDGHVRLGYVDPVDIDDVVTDRDNALIPVTVVLKSVNGRPKRFLKVVRQETWANSPAYGLLATAAPGERDLASGSGQVYDGSCLLLQINKLSGAKRGRSDLLALIDWLDGYDGLLFDQMDRATLLDSFIWHVTLEGYTEEQIDAWLKKNGKVRRGAMRASNEKVKWEALAPDLKATDKDTMLRMLRGHMLGSKSIPEHYYGLAGEVNLASAKEMGLPTVKRMTRRQNTVKEFIREMARFAVHQAKAHGVLEGDVAALDETIQVELPEISMRDQTAIAQAIAQATVAISQAEQQGWIQKPTAARLFAVLAGQFGVAIDAAAEVTPQGQPVAEAMRDYADPAKVRHLRDRLGDQS